LIDGAEGGFLSDGKGKKRFFFGYDKSLESYKDTNLKGMFSFYFNRKILRKKSCAPKPANQVWPSATTVKGFYQAGPPKREKFLHDENAHELTGLR